MDGARQVAAVASTAPNVHGLAQQWASAGGHEHLQRQLQHARARRLQREAQPPRAASADAGPGADALAVRAEAVRAQTLAHVDAAIELGEHPFLRGRRRRLLGIQDGRRRGHLRPVENQDLSIIVNLHRRVRIDHSSI